MLRFQVRHTVERKEQKGPESKEEKAQKLQHSGTSTDSDVKNNMTEIKQVVLPQEEKAKLQANKYVKEQRRKYTLMAGIVEFWFRSQPLFKDFQKDLMRAITEEEHYFEDEFYRASPSEVQSSSSKVIER